MRQQRSRASTGARARSSDARCLETTRLLLALSKASLLEPPAATANARGLGGLHNPVSALDEIWLQRYTQFGPVTGKAEGDRTSAAKGWTPAGVVEDHTLAGFRGLVNVCQVGVPRPLLSDGKEVETGDVRDALTRGVEAAFRLRQGVCWLREARSWLKGAAESSYKLDAVGLPAVGS